MTLRELALAFVRRFARGDLAALGELLADDFRFRGPLLQCATRSMYLNTLASDPWSPRPFSLRHIVEDDGAVAIFYRLGGPEPVEVAQWFEGREGRLTATRVVFAPSTESENEG